MRAEELLRRVDAWVFASEDPRRLAAVRIGLCGSLALLLASIDFDAVAGRPTALFHPVFYMKVFARMPSHQVAETLQALGIVTALAAAAGLVLRLSLPTAFVCALILNGMRNSAGRVIVGDALLMLCLLVLLAGGAAAGERWSARALAPRRAPVADPPGRGIRYGWPVRTAMLVIALAYFFAGFQKWRYSGLPWVTSGNLRWILYDQSHPNELALFVANRPWLAHGLAAGALLLETCFPLVLFVPALRWLFVPGAVAMHVGIRLTLGLNYSAQWLTVLIVFVNWPVVVDAVRSRVARFPVTREAPG